MSNTDKPKIYLMIECPFCLKFRIFLSEAGLDDKVEFVVFKSGDDTHQAVRNRMIEAGQKPSFPAAELEEGKLTTETDHLIEHFSQGTSIDAKTLPLLNYYLDGVFQRFGAMHKELAELKEKVGK